MKKLFERIAMTCALLICLLLVATGVIVWFTDIIWIARFVASFLLVVTGVGLGAVGIDLWRDE